jgi:predicted 3-demethylubiquinone-9 3-methyltransferase (glyoxalase superfamily)
MMPTITPFLWFDTQAEDAATLYTSVFKNSRIGRIARYGAAGPGPKGSVMTVEFQIEGKSFIALNGGPQFKFTEAISFVVGCETQEEIDALWAQLTADGGKASQCGWLKDKFGLSWQIVPNALGRLMSDPDPEKSKRVMNALLQMEKLDLSKLQQAFDGV